ncbi:unnamed protein product [Meloidogyne enterolobii]|uniref:Uncharacterized protein n=1 Tax=Meloidogyne enterolobii TaxID=390850 RepID=A0ACB1A0N6_MELEN
MKKNVERNVERNVEKNREINTNKSPYEELPRFGEGDEEENSQSENYENKEILNGDKGRKSKRHHGRGSLARHTLGVDVSWLKRLVTNKHGISEENNNKHESNKEEKNNKQNNRQENNKHENIKQNKHEDNKHENNKQNKHENNKHEDNKHEKNNKHEDNKQNNKQEKNIKHENNTQENILNNNNNKHLDNIRTQQHQHQHKHSPPTLNRSNKHEEGETTRFSSTSSTSSTNSQKQQKHNPRLDSFDLINKNLKKGTSTISSLRKIKAAFASRPSSERRQIITNKNTNFILNKQPPNTTNSLIVSVDLSGNLQQKSLQHQRSLSQCYCRSIPPPLSSTDLAKIKESSISNSSPPSSAPPILNNKLNHRFIQNGNLKFNSTTDKNIAVPRMGISAGAGAVN